MFWTVVLDVQFVGPEANVDIEDATDAYLVALTDHPDVGGAVTAVNLQTRIIEARFDVEAPDLAQAFARGQEIATAVLNQIEVRNTIAHRAEILRLPSDAESLTTALV